MLGIRSRIYVHLSAFHKKLFNSDSKEQISQALSEIILSWNAQSAAVIQIGGAQGSTKKIDKLIDVGSTALWQAYRGICHTNREPLSRIMRLSPHPVALSDLQQHARLTKRSTEVRDLFQRHGYSDAIALPVFDRQANFFMVLIAGKNPNLGPTNRHLMARVATDTVLHLQELAATPVAGMPVSAVPETLKANPQMQPPKTGSLRDNKSPDIAAQPRHLSLTPRQLEIAPWLVAGKSDWEIGEILKISPKTVNFHVENIKRRYGVRSRNQFVAAIVQDGGLNPSST